MIAPFCQRWRGRRASFRPSGELFDTRAHEVAAIDSDAIARAFVEEHHYSGSYPAARRRFGLYTRGALVGVAVFSVPANTDALAPFEGGLEHNVDLGRFVLLDGVRTNGESWFIARCLELLGREGFEGVVSFADPEPRTRGDGELVFPGHIGQIYQATNAIYVGRATARTLHLLPDGTVFSARNMSKIRRRERGWRYAVEQLVEHGAPSPGDDLRAWLPGALARVCRTMRHRGNHKYLFPLTRGARSTVASLHQSYPRVNPAVRCVGLHERCVARGLAVAS